MADSFIEWYAILKKSSNIVSEELLLQFLTIFLNYIFVLYDTVNMLLNLSLLKYLVMTGKLYIFQYKMARFYNQKFTVQGNICHPIIIAIFILCTK